MKKLFFLKKLLFEKMFLKIEMFLKKNKKNNFLNFKFLKIFLKILEKKFINSKEVIFGKKIFGIKFFNFFEKNL